MTEPSALATLRALEAQMTPNWSVVEEVRRDYFGTGTDSFFAIAPDVAGVVDTFDSDGAGTYGGIVREADARGAVAMRNAFPALLAVAEAASEALVECDSLERGESWWRNLAAALAALEEVGVDG